MGNSRRFHHLRKRIRSLENSILPPINPTGDYSDEEQDYIRSYILLCHAEIEFYFEQRAKARASKALKRWRKKRRNSHVIKSIIAFVGNEMNFNKIQNSDHLESRIEKSVSHFVNLLKHNHGIKEKNILNILLPLGIEKHELDQTWLNTMNSFGSIRGEIAHSSFAVQNPIDLKTQKDIVNNQILPEIKSLDQQISRLF